MKIQIFYLFRSPVAENEEEEEEETEQAPEDLVVSDDD
jgi:hypothetical protein